MGSSRQLKRHATVKSSVVLLYADTPAWHLAFLVEIVQVIEAVVVACDVRNCLVIRCLAAHMEICERPRDLRLWRLARPQIMTTVRIEPPRHGVLLHST